MKTNVENLLKDVLAHVEGKNANEIHFENLRDRKKKKAPVKAPELAPQVANCVDSGEGLVLTDVGPSVEDWSSIRKRREHKLKTNLEEWGSFDFYFFTQDVYRRRYGEEWNLRVGGCSVEINRIRDLLMDFAGFVSNLMMRDYILWFVEHHMDYYKKRSGFYFSHMKDQDKIARFVDSYDYRASFTAYMNHEKALDLASFRITAKEVEKSYTLGGTTLLCNYGIVISMNWLLLNKKMSAAEAVGFILNICRQLKMKDLLDVIVEATNSYSPYPSWLPFQKPEAILSKVDPKQKVEVRFTEITSKQFIFLRKKSVKEKQWEDSIE
jgi:hypothetical protein